MGGRGGEGKGEGGLAAQTLHVAGAKAAGADVARADTHIEGAVLTLGGGGVLTLGGGGRRGQARRGERWRGGGGVGGRRGGDDR